MQGLHDATLDERHIDAWWSNEPDLNIGLRTGIAFDVVDVDSDEGVAALDVIAPHWRPTGPKASTGKGAHLYVHVTGLPNSAGRIVGLDYRGQNGYVVAPPSIHPLGHLYQWATDGPLGLLHPDLRTALAAQAQVAERRFETPHLDAAKRDLDIFIEFAAIGVTDYRPHGRAQMTQCRFHPDRNPSMAVYADTQSFFCFGCGAWGDALNLRRFQREGKLR